MAYDQSGAYICRGKPKVADKFVHFVSERSAQEMFPQRLDKALR
jgi:hypothetical protein